MMGESHEISVEPLHLIKLCVGAGKVQDLVDWNASRRAANPGYVPRHVTRMWPKRADEILNGGSLYWVFRGFVLARQRIARFDEVIGEDGIRRCGIIMESEIYRTEAIPRRAFQGWRYLSEADAPRDLSMAGAHEADDVPPALLTALAEIGVR